MTEPTAGAGAPTGSAADHPPGADGGRPVGIVVTWASNAPRPLDQPGETASAGAEPPVAGSTGAAPGAGATGGPPVEGGSVEGAPVIAAPAAATPEVATTEASRTADATTAPPRLAPALLAYVFALTLVVTLAPFDFAAPRSADLWVDGGWVEAAANAALFLPLGFLWRLARPRPSGGRGRDRLALRVLGAGLAGSLVIEGAQFFLPGRYPALGDLAANALGAWLGGLLHDAAERALRSDERIVSGLALELPLMVLLYMLVPLMWLNGLALLDAPLATLRLLMLGLFGASLLAAVQRRHLGPAGALGRWGAAGAAAAGYLVGAFPALLLRPAAVAGHALLVAGLCAYLATGHPGRIARERRFERDALRRAAPYFAAYLLLLPLVTPAAPAAGPVPLSRVLLLELVQAAAASTLLGYMVAESRGRRIQRYRDSVGWVVCWAALAVGVTGWVASVVGLGRLGLTRLAAAIVAALVGGWLYHRQRDRVRTIAARRPVPTPEVPPPSVVLR